MIDQKKDYSKVGTPLPSTKIPSLRLPRYSKSLLGPVDRSVCVLRTCNSESRSWFTCGEIKHYLDEATAFLDGLSLPHPWLLDNQGEAGRRIVSMLLSGEGVDPGVDATARAWAALRKEGVKFDIVVPISSFENFQFNGVVIGCTSPDVGSDNVESVLRRELLGLEYPNCATAAMLFSKDPETACQQREIEKRRT